MSKPRRKLKGTRSFYDRIADVQGLAMRINGYRSSVAKYLRSLDLDIGPDSCVLDAGSGTGIISLAFADAGFQPKQLVAFDLSYRSLQVAGEQFRKEKKLTARSAAQVQGNILELPFDDDSFQVVLSCGVLEYVDLDAGLREIARVVQPGGRLVLIPVKPSLVGTVLEFLYKFKLHPESSVRSIAGKYFDIIGDAEFSLTEPIGWSKKIFLLQKPK